MDDQRLVELAQYACEDPRHERSLRALVELRASLDEIEGARVRAMVAEGATWRDIGAALGVSAQAAHKRHGGGAGRKGRRKHADAARRQVGAGRVLVTGQARRVVALAREEAARVGVDAVGTEHLLLGVLRAGGSVATKALRAAGVTVSAARAQLVDTSRTNGNRPSPPATGVSDDARKALEHSLSESVRRGDGYIGPEHLLLSILHERRGAAVRALRGLEVSPKAVEGELERRTHG